MLNAPKHKRYNLLSYKKKEKKVNQKKKQKENFEVKKV